MNLARFRALMRTVAGQLARTVRRLLRLHGAPVTDAQRTALAKALHPHITRARGQAHRYGTQRLTTQARMARVTVPPVPVRPYPIAAVVSVLENATRVDDAGPRSRATVTVTPNEDAPERARVRVSTREPEPDAPRRGRAKVSVRVLDEQTRRARRATVEITDANRHDPQVVKVVSAKVEATVERHVRMASREAVTDTVRALAELREAREQAIARSTERALASRREAPAAEQRPTGRAREQGPPAGERIGWARVLTGGENCPFCAMLASRGPVYTSKQAALFVGVGVDAYHDNCDCEVVLVVEGRDWVGREQYDNLEQLWIESTAGTSGKESVKAFARSWNEKVASRQVDDYMVRADTEPDTAPGRDDGNGPTDPPSGGGPARGGDDAGDWRMHPDDVPDSYPSVSDGTEVPFTPALRPMFWDEDWEHILDGDPLPPNGAGGGGHRHGTAREGKTEFPAWEDRQAQAAMDRTLAAPTVVHRDAETGTLQFVRQESGRIFRVSVDDRYGDPFVVTGHPLCGDGIRRMRNGQYEDLPLDLRHLEGK
ncbi:hypothetical protein P9990_17615 [Prescottella equi]|uniref:VG15 protein n=1 Tax=Rhodococcus hoagii TaxID=43767 RepID=UPI002576FFC9|nr:hypothetical protein [Prescottella equi]WJJ10390.1 hypothetical protein P9990_17615 [Prescottella equi]